ncbi:hypothetical protein DEU56DRAFT_771864, partial [Suillus clintonianus]|uniref:uncharacterized protein n=1 Tax=Suillus clintonianus TaxID=1904413 RepID=UPI001B878BEB
MSDPHQLPRSGNVHPPRSSSISRDAHSHSTSANVNTATPRTSQGESLRRPAAHSDTIHQADHYNSTQQDAGNLMGNTNVYNPTLPLAEDLTGQIFGTINGFVAGGSFGNVYKCCSKILQVSHLRAGLKEISTRSRNLGTPRPRQYCHTLWNDRGVWANHSPGLPVVSGRHAAPSDHGTGCYIDHQVQIEAASLHSIRALLSSTRFLLFTATSQA